MIGFCYHGGGMTGISFAHAGNNFMSVVMPALDEAVLGRRKEIVAALRAIVPGEGVIAGAHSMKPYESDGLTAYRQTPDMIFYDGK